MSRRRKKTLLDSSVNTARMMDVLRSRQSPKKATKAIPTIQLPEAETKTPDPAKPIDWFESYERHVARD